MGLLSKLFGKKKDIIKREGNPDVYNMPNENERMNWAMEKARLTLHYFEACLANPKEGQDYFSIKARIEDNGNVEHIWLRDSSFDNDGNIFGVVGNEPIQVTNVSINEKIGIDKDHVSDWMIIEKGKLIGGYTIRAIRDGLQGEAALADFDANLGGMFVDEGEDYFMPNLDTPEGAILALEEAYDNDNLEAAMRCKDFYKEAEFMLQKMEKLELDDSLITKTAEVLELSYVKSMEEHGMPKFKDIKRAFTRDKVSDNQYIITEICHYPDGGKSFQKMNTFKVDDQWKVLGLVE